MKIFLKEENGVILLQNGKHRCIFDTPDVYKLHSGIDLTDVPHVLYHPEEGFKVDKSQKDALMTVEFEEVILAELNQISTYQANLADPYYGKTDTECTEIKKVELKNDLMACLLGAYDIGVQISLNTFLADPTTTQKVKDRIGQVFTWIKTVLVYYYDLKESIPSDWGSVTWDFSTFEATDPKLQLVTLIR